MLNPITTYSGPLQHFSFRAEGNNIVAQVTDKVNNGSSSVFKVDLPPEASAAIKTKGPIVVLDRMLKNGFYPYIKDKQLVLAQGLSGGNPTYVARDWSKPVKETLKIEGHKTEVESVIELRDGSLVSRSSRDPTFKLWDRKGNCLQTFKGHTGGVTALIELKDGTLAS